MIGGYLIDPTRSAHTLEDTALRASRLQGHSGRRSDGQGTEGRAAFRMSAGSVEGFCLRTGRSPGAARAGAVERLASEGLTEVWERFERPLIPVLVAIERAGVSIDGPALAAQSERFVRELDALSRRIFELAGTRFNIASPKQLGEVLFEKMQLPVLKRTGRARTISTAVDVLEEWR